MNMPLSHVDDQQLILTTQTAPRPAADHAFAALITRHASPVHAHVARSLSPDTSSVEDLVQLVRLRAWLRLRRAEPLILNERKTFEHYLCAVARNVVRDHHNELNEQRAHEDSLEDLQERSPERQLGSPEPAADRDGAPVHALRHALLATIPATALRQQQDRQLAHRAHDALTQHYALDGRSMEYAAATWVQGECRDAFILSIVAGLKQHEIATRLGIPLGTVGWRVSSGRRQYEAAYALLLWEEDGATEDDIARQFARLHGKNDGADAAEIARRVASEAQRVPHYLQEGRKLRAGFLRRITKSGGLASDQR